MLVVEDDDDQRQLFEVIIGLFGLETVAVASGEDALAMVRDGGIHLVLTDLSMPGMSGDEVCRAVKEINPAIPVMILTATDSVERAVSLLKTGADDYLVKPIDPDILRARLIVALKLLRAVHELERLNDLINRSLEVPTQFDWGTSRAMLNVLARLPRLARTRAPIIIYGESGTGKELIAQAIHYSSRRASGPLISVNCGATPETLWEREFFGHVKGAFSDAGAGAPGLIAEAEGGTLFLDEVGEIPLSQQAKLLRFLQQREYRPVGSTKTLNADVRVISATNRDLKAQTESSLFRKDLFFRLNVMTLHVPALRDRKDDIPTLANHLVRRYALEFERDIDGLSPRAIAKLCSYDYPGNVRELENIVQQLVAETDSSVIVANSVPVGDVSIVEPGHGGTIDATTAAPYQPSSPRTDLPYNEAKAAVISEFERAYVSTLLDQHGGHIGNAAEAAGVSRRSFSRVLSRNPGARSSRTSE